MNRWHLQLIALLLGTASLQAQTEKNEAEWSLNEGTMIGMGMSQVKDTYLSPLTYKGWGLRVLDERIKMVRLANYAVSRQQIINVDISSTLNPAETARNFSGFIDYALAYHYRFRPTPNLRVLAGASAHLMGGFIYNSRNGNNPATAKVDAELSLSGMAIYSLRIKNYPLTLRYQIDLPFVGVLFSPHFGQSYYEIFDLGNADGVIRLGAWHNKFQCKNYLTVDFPVGNMNMRVGYLHSFYSTDVNNIQSRITSNTFMIGIVKEFVSFGGKRLKEKNKYKSAFYQ